MQTSVSLAAEHGTNGTVTVANTYFGPTLIGIDIRENGADKPYAAPDVNLYLDLSAALQLLAAASEAVNRLRTPGGIPVPDDDAE